MDICQSESSTKLIPALIKIQQEIPIMVKEGSTNTTQKRFSCVRLERMLEVLLPICNKHNVLLQQRSYVKVNNHNGDLFVILETRVDHISGEWRSSMTYLFPASMLSGDTQQEAGKIRSYQCRQELKSFFCIITADEDYDDGIVDDAYITPQQSSELYRMMMNMPEENKKTFFGIFKISHTKMLKKELYQKAKEALEALENQ